MATLGLDYCIVTFPYSPNETKIGKFRNLLGDKIELCSQSHDVCVVKPKNSI